MLSLLLCACFIVSNFSSLFLVWFLLVMLNVFVLFFLLHCSCCSCAQYLFFSVIDVDVTVVLCYGFVLLNDAFFLSLLTSLLLLLLLLSLWFLFCDYYNSNSYVVLFLFPIFVSCGSLLILLLLRQLQSACCQNPW